MKRIILLSAIFIAGATFMSAQRTTLTQKTIFADSQQTGLDYVLRLDPDRLLAPCCNALGKTPKAPAYGGWESQQIAGHSLGHYLSALAGFQYQTGDRRAKEKLDYTVHCLKEMQRPDGYVGGVYSLPFDTVASGQDFKVERFSLAGFWVPWYSVHKIYAGLLDAYTYGGNQEALDVVTKMCDWAINEFKDTDDATFQKMLYCEHGGMCKVFADMYGITHDAKYLAMAERFIDREIIIPAEQQKDDLAGHHANTQIPKFIGLARLYELTGKQEYRTAVEFFFSTVTKTRSYVIGGNSLGEHFQEQYKETLGYNTCETCNTYNMLELAEHVFDWNRTSDTADFYETALYNHILSSQDPSSGAKTYFVSTKPGTFHVYCTADNAFWCCTGTGMENPERYNRFICRDIDDTLYVNLFIPSTVTTGDGWKIQIETLFPYSDSVTVKVIATGTKPKTLKVRIPSWTGGSGYADKGALHAGESLSFTLPMTLHTRKTRDRTGNFSVLYGPIALAADLGKKGLPASDTVNDQLVLQNYPSVPFSGFNKADPDHPETWIHETDASSLSFTTDAAVSDTGTSYTLKPFYTIHHEMYSLYFNTENMADKSREAKLDTLTIDSVEPGRQQSEIDHRIKENNTITGYNAHADRNFRATSGSNSFITYRIKFKNEKENHLLVSVAGTDKGTFSITVADRPLTSVTLDGTHGDGLYDIDCAIPAPLLEDAAGGKKTAKLNVSFVPEDGTVLHLLELRTLNGNTAE